MQLLPPPTTAHWVYEDPSGVDQRPAAAPVPLPKPKRGTIIPFPTRHNPATPKAA
jgi:hypothetical protein